MNVNSEVILEYWGTDNLLKIDDATMQDLDLPTDAKAYLVEVGLVRNSKLMSEALGIAFDAIGGTTIVTLASYFNRDLQENEISESLSSWIVLGHCYDKLVCISSDDGTVINLEGDPESGFMDWFVNTSVSKYILFITMAIQSFEKGTGDSNVAKLVEELRREFSEADPEAMSKHTHWWPIILGDIQTM